MIALGGAAGAIARYEAVIEEARRQDLAGATAYRGIEGYGASTRIHRKHLFTSSDLPIMIAIVDTEEKISPCRRSTRAGSIP